MPTKPPPTDLPIIAFATAKELEAYFDREHETSSGFHMKIARKSTGIPTVSSEESIAAALCFGWIDGQGNSFDDDFYLRRFTPRRSKSLWSKKNVETVAKLLEQGRMRPAGIAAVEAAKADGRWERAYARPSTISVPDDLAAALATNPSAAAHFENMKKGDRYQLLLRIYNGSPATRAKRVATIVDTLANGEGSSKLMKKATDSTKDTRSKKKASARKATAANERVNKEAGSDRTAGQNETTQPRRPGLRKRV